MHSRRPVNLHLLPQPLQYLIAIAVAAAVMLAAWHVGHGRPAPGWLGPFMAVWTWLGPGLLAFFVARWLLHRGRKP